MIALTVDRYRTFLVAARCPTFFEAAEELYITPATVSKHIAALERELGVVLFERRPHGVALTAAGERKLPLVRQLVEICDALGGGEAREQRQELTVLASPPPSRYVLGPIMDGFAAGGTGIRLNILERRGVSAAVLGGEYELGLTGSGRLDPQQMQYICIQRFQLGAVLPAKHPLAGRQSVSLRELREDRFVFPNPETGATPKYVEFCRRCGFEPQVSCYGYREDSILFYVSRGEGVALLTREMFDLFNYKNVVFLPLEEQLFVSDYLIRSRGRVLSPAAQMFWSYVKKNHSVKDSG